MANLLKLSLDGNDSIQTIFGLSDEEVNSLSDKIRDFISGCNFRIGLKEMMKWVNDNAETPNEVAIYLSILLGMSKSSNTTKD